MVEAELLQAGVEVPRHAKRKLISMQISQSTTQSSHQPALNIPSNFDLKKQSEMNHVNNNKNSNNNNNKKNTNENVAKEYVDPSTSASMSPHQRRLKSHSTLNALSRPAIRLMSQDSLTLIK